MCSNINKDFRKLSKIREKQKMRIDIKTRYLKEWVAWSCLQITKHVCILGKCFNVEIENKPTCMYCSVIEPRVNFKLTKEMLRFCILKSQLNQLVNLNSHWENEQHYQYTLMLFPLELLVLSLDVLSLVSLQKMWKRC